MHNENAALAVVVAAWCDAERRIGAALDDDRRRKRERGPALRRAVLRLRVLLALVRENLRIEPHPDAAVRRRALDDAFDRDDVQVGHAALDFELLVLGGDGGKLADQPNLAESLQLF